MNSDIQGSLRGRIGIAWDRFLFYGTGGVAFAGVTDNYNQLFGPTPTPTPAAIVNRACPPPTTCVPAIPPVIAAAPASPLLGTGSRTGDSFSKTRAGWTVGGGIEYAITNNWSIRGEYRYTDFGRYSDIVANTSFGVPLAVVTVNHHLTENQVLFGFGYRFDTFTLSVSAN